MHIAWLGVMCPAVFCLLMGNGIKALLAQNPLPVTTIETPLSSQSQIKNRLPFAKLDGNYFSVNGQRFIPMGVHWVPAKTALQWPVQWDAKDIEADFSKMHLDIIPCVWT